MDSATSDAGERTRVLATAREARDDGMSEWTPASPGHVFYLFDADRPARPLARFTDEADARSAVGTFELLGRRATLLSRDESRNRPRPSFWKLEYSSPTRRSSRSARG